MGLWKDISRENRQLNLDSVFVLGDGSRISFGEDIWCDEGPLCETFPALYSLIVTKGANVADVWDNSIVIKGAPQARLKPRHHHSQRQHLASRLKVFFYNRDQNDIVLVFYIHIYIYKHCFG